MPEKLTERYIQDRLASTYLFERNHIAAINNFHMTYGECDLLTITQAKFAYEFEIKLSKADFRADFKKAQKHKALSTGQPQGYWASHHVSKNHAAISWQIPARFYYVTPHDMITHEDIPPYAGWIALIRHRTRWLAETMVPAPAIHKEKVSDDFIRNVYEKCQRKYWWKRCHGEWKDDQ